MGNSASSRAKAQAKAAAAAVSAATNAGGGDVVGSSESVQPSTSSDSAAAKMSTTFDTSKFVNGEEFERIKDREDSADDTDYEDTEFLPRAPLQAEVFKEPVLTRTLSLPILRELKREYLCEDDVPDDPDPGIEFLCPRLHPRYEPGEISLSSTEYLLTESGYCYPQLYDSQTQTSASSAVSNHSHQQHQPTAISSCYFADGGHQHQYMYPGSEGAFPVGLEGRRPLDDRSPEVFLDDQKQQLSPAAFEGFVPSGMEGDAKAAGVVDSHKFYPVADVTVCQKGARPKVINVGHEDADKSNDLPPVS